jgi:hypothetical protein
MGKETMTVQACTGSQGFSQLGFAEFLDIRYPKVEKSVLGTGSLYPQEISLVLIYGRG